MILEILIWVHKEQFLQRFRSIGAAHTKASANMTYRYCLLRSSAGLVPDPHS